MAQKNYFSYNIIDTLYFNQPTGTDLQKIYGNTIPASFVRRNSIEYDQMNPDEQRLYDKNERNFIEAVINKYIMDDFGKGSYIGIDTNYHDNNENELTKEITYAYFKTSYEVGIELSDMISNINGVHNYKLISAKDIDFDNIILPNSAISRDFNWGGFDRNRRWGDKPIHINNTFELLNVIDYLLCACDNLWNELYKLKYSVNEGVEIWFTKNASDRTLISSSMKLVVQDFQRDNIERTEATRMITYLDPFNYYTSLNNNAENNFGMVTNFYVVNEDSDDLTFDRKIIDNKGRNIILMIILPNSKAIGQANATTTQNVNSTLQQIYAYKIGNELKIYPGSRIDAFINENYIINNNSNNLVDFKNKKLKYETYFKSNSRDNIYSQIYIEFLNTSKFNQSIKNPYLLYYINDSNIKVVVSYNYEGSGQGYATNILDIILSNINNAATYSLYKHTSSEDDNFNVITNEYEPKFYIIPDEFFSTLEVATPNSRKFSASSQSIRIYYYKNSNNLTCKVTRLKDDEEIEIEPENDPTQSNSLSYNYFRYNVPDGQKITFEFDSSYIALDSTNEGNPLGLKLDDEYKDIMLYNPNSVADEDKEKYYQFINTEDSGTYKRLFEKFTIDTFDTRNYINIDNKSQSYKHIWVKYDNPYKLNLTIDNDELITQSLIYSDVNNEINKIIKNNELNMISYNKYTLEHTLSDGIEEIKFNLRFHIDETSKVKATECIIPLNINKIYYPTINYYTYNAMELERANYNNIEYTYTVSGINQKATLSEIYNKTFRKYDYLNSKLNLPQNVYKIMSTDQADINTLDDLQLQKSYDCTTNNAIFEFTYNHYKSNIVNLIGGWYTENYIKRHLKKDFAATKLKFNNNSSEAILKSEINTDLPYSYHLYMFNLNGFGRNYRLHGNGHTLPGNYNNSTSDISSLYPEFDLISIASNKDYQSINEQLKFKLDDNNTQLSHIAIEMNNNEYVWTQNDLEFNSGYNIKHTKNNISYNDYIIKTRPVDIYKTSYIINCINNYESQNTTYTTYYLPIAYMQINSSTFNPPESTKPSGIIPDINDDEEKRKYGEYMNCWNDDTNYHPITAYIKLFNNTTYSNPYYYDSNEAVIQFNINRTTFPSSNNFINGRTYDWIYVSTDSMYYLSDFIEMGINKSDFKEGFSLGSCAPTGSYYYYDEKYSEYIVNEIYANKYIENLGSSHNDHYQYVNLDLSYINTLLNPDTPENIDSRSYIIPYPIFNQMIVNNDSNNDNDNDNDNDNNVTFSSTSYNFDIYRLADINKLDITRVSAITTTWDNSNQQINHTNDQIEDHGIYTNTTYYTVKFDNTFVNSFGRNYYGNNDETGFNMILYQIYYERVKGSKNYKSGMLSTGSTNTFICPIIRQYNGAEPYNGLYLTTTYQEKRYEFFRFKYDDIYIVKKIENNDNIKYYQYCSVAPNKNFSCKDAYDYQLKVFLFNSMDEFLANQEYINELKNNQDINIEINNQIIQLS